MSNEKFSHIPDTSGYTLDDAREWYGKLYDQGIYGFHVDDIYTPKHGEPSEFGHMFTPEAEAKWIEITTNFVEASKSWVDPDFIYDLAANGRFVAMETTYPGFIMDRGLIVSARTGYSPVKYQDKPTIFAEEYGTIIAIEIDTPTGKLSDATQFTIMPVANAYHTDTGIEAKNPVLDRENGLTATTIEEVEEAVEKITTPHSMIKP